MAQITLSKKQVKALSAFLRKHNKDKFFLAKDQGAYVGATGGDHEEGNFENLIFYFRGMDPSKETYDGEAYDNARYAFGGDDFGEHMNGEFIHRASVKSLKVRIKVTPTQLIMESAS